MSAPRLSESLTSSCGRALALLLLAAAGGWTCSDGDGRASNGAVDAALTDDSAEEAGEDAVEHDAPAAPDGAEDAAADGTTDGAGEEPRGVWLRGDLHLHSSHSRDALDNPVDRVIALAESVGMDFFVFTDHDNHVDGRITTWSDPLYASDRMLMLHGVELTTGRAHANLFGVDPWDHPAIYALRDEDGAVLIDAAHAQGLHFSVNHPLNQDPWEHSFDLPFDSIEVWNSIYRFPHPNQATIELWDTLLSTGRRLPARGGSDCHHQETFEANFLNVGNPTTWVFAEERSGAAVLTALGQGRASISYAPAGERVELMADVDGDGRYEVMMGDETGPVAGTVRFRVRVEGFRDDVPPTLRVVRDGVVVDEVMMDGPEYAWDDAEAAQARYVRVELRGSPVHVPSPGALRLYGDLLALSNPVYLPVGR